MAIICVIPSNSVALEIIRRTGCS